MTAHITQEQLDALERNTTADEDFFAMPSRGDLLAAQALVKAQKPKRAKRKKSTGASEQQIQKAIIEYLARRQDVAFVMRVNSGGAIQNKRTNSWVAQAPAGTADIVACITVVGIGVWASIEVKRGAARFVKRRNGKIDKQKEHHDLISGAGGIAIITNGVEDCQRNLDIEIAHIMNSGKVLPF